MISPEISLETRHFGFDTPSVPFASFGSPHSTYRSGICRRGAAVVRVAEK
jgi:hypothetical protein